MELVEEGQGALQALLQQQLQLLGGEGGHLQRADEASKRAQARAGPGRVRLLRRQQLDGIAQEAQRRIAALCGTTARDGAPGLQGKLPSGAAPCAAPRGVEAALPPRLPEQAAHGTKRAREAMQRDLDLASPSGSSRRVSARSTRQAVPRQRSSTPDLAMPGGADSPPPLVPDW